MTKIRTYATDSTIVSGDKIIGTDAADNSTKNYTVGGLETYYEGNGVLMDVATYDPAGIATQLVGLTTTQTLTNKTIDFSSGGTNTITLDSSDADYSNGASGLTATNVQAAIDEIISTYDPAGLSTQLVGLTSTQTLTNKTMDFSSGGTNTITLDSSDVDYDNATSGLSATNVKAAIDEVVTEKQPNISYKTNNEATANYSLVAGDNWTVQARGAGAGMTTTLTSTVLGNMDDSATFAIQNTDGNAMELLFTGVTVYGHVSGTITASNQGDMVWFKKIDGTNVAMWGDYTITP